MHTDAGTQTTDGAGGAPSTKPEHDATAPDGSSGMGPGGQDGAVFDAASDARGSDAPAGDAGPPGRRPDAGTDSGESCATLHRDQPQLPSGEYTIDPDSPAGTIAPFVVYCDMTTDGGGWTTLPLRFDDAAFWSITRAGTACVTTDMQDNDGNYRQYFSMAGASFAYTYMQFVPPVAVTTVRFVDFNFTNGGAQNTMDFAIGGLPSDTTREGWYFAAPAAPGTPIGYAFPNAASCVSPFDIEYDVTCSRDNLTSQANAFTGPLVFNAEIQLSTPSTNFVMGLVEGCQSNTQSPLTSGEQFHIETAPGAGGVWHTGIQIR